MYWCRCVRSASPKLQQWTFSWSSDAYDTIRRMRFTTQWRTAFRVKSFKAVVIRGKLSGEGGEAVGAVGD